MRLLYIHTSYETSTKKTEIGGIFIWFASFFVFGFKKKLHAWSNAD